MSVILKSSAENNRRTADHRRHSATEIIRFFGYSRSTVYDIVAKYTALEQFNKCSIMSARKSYSKERTAKTPAVVERIQADFEWLRAIAKISINCWCKQANNMPKSTSIQIIHIKDTTDALCQDKPNCLLQSAIVFFEKRSIGTKGSFLKKFLLLMPNQPKK